VSSYLDFRVISLTTPFLYFLLLFSLSVSLCSGTLNLVKHMSYKTADDSTSLRKRGQSTGLAERLGQHAQRELALPLCFTCSTQTDYSGQDLQIDVQDSEYHW
jgi:hypothetical protein